jgi:hypothetical protein
LQQFAEASLRLAGEDRNTQVHCFSNLGRKFRQHGEATADVEAPYAHRYAGSAKWAGDVHRSWKLIGLHANERNQPAIAAFADGSGDPFRPNAGIDFVINPNLNSNVVTEHPILDAVVRDAVQSRKRIGRDV